MPKFKLYGYVSGSDRKVPLELDRVAVCFEDEESLAELSGFLAACLTNFRSNERWDHEHVFSDDGRSDLSVVRLDPGNVSTPTT